MQSTIQGVNRASASFFFNPILTRCEGPNRQTNTSTGDSGIRLHPPESMLMHPTLPLGPHECFSYELENG